MVLMTPKRGTQKLDLANWARKNLPSLGDGGDLSAAEWESLGEWISKQAYVQYDNGDKLK